SGLPTWSGSKRTARPPRFLAPAPPPTADPGRTRCCRTPGSATMSGMERLNKVLAHAGVGSRRHCDELILGGRVSVDGQVVRELGTKVEPEQKVSVDGRPLHGERLVY